MCPKWYIIFGYFLVFLLMVADGGCEQQRSGKCETRELAHFKSAYIQLHTLAHFKIACIQLHTARGSRTTRASGCNLLKRGRNVAKLVCDWFRYSKWIQKWMKRAILFQQGFKAIYFENINKNMNIGPEQEDRKGRGTNFSNFLLEQYFI